MGRSARAPGQAVGRTGWQAGTREDIIEQRAKLRSVAQKDGWIAGLEREKGKRKLRDWRL